MTSRLDLIESALESLANDPSNSTRESIIFSLRAKIFSAMAETIRQYEGSLNSPDKKFTRDADIELRATIYESLAFGVAFMLANDTPRLKRDILKIFDSRVIDAASMIEKMLENFDQKLEEAGITTSTTQSSSQQSSAIREMVEENKKRKLH